MRVILRGRLYFILKKSTSGLIALCVCSHLLVKLLDLLVHSSGHGDWVAGEHFAWAIVTRGRAVLFDLIRVSSTLRLRLIGLPLGAQFSVKLDLLVEHFAIFELKVVLRRFLNPARLNAQVHELLRLLACEEALALEVVVLKRLSLTSQRSHFKSHF